MYVCPTLLRDILKHFKALFVFAAAAVPLMANAAAMKLWEQKRQQGQGQRQELDQESVGAPGMHRVATLHMIFNALAIASLIPSTVLRVMIEMSLMNLMMIVLMGTEMTAMDTIANGSMLRTMIRLMENGTDCVVMMMKRYLRGNGRICCIRVHAGSDTDAPTRMDPRRTLRAAEMNLPTSCLLQKPGAAEVRRLIALMKPVSCTS